MILKAHGRPPGHPHDAEPMRAIYNLEVLESTVILHHRGGLGLRSSGPPGPGPGRRTDAARETLVDLARQHGFHAVIARIVGGHEASIALHQRCGFELVGIEKEVSRRFGRWLDLVEMQRLVT